MHLIRCIKKAWPSNLVSGRVCINDVLQTSYISGTFCLCYSAALVCVLSILNQALDEHNNETREVFNHNCIRYAY